VPDETGLLVEPADAKALAAAIVRLLKDADLRKQLGEAGRERVAEHFGVDRLVEGTLESYRRIASR
jgi:glycosyltransferase involved in cell wall biosynthesis